MSLSRIETLIRQLQGMLGGNRVVRGAVNSGGTIAWGSGFTVNKTGTGAYTVTFDPAFSAEPAVTITAAAAGVVAAKINSTAAGSVQLTTFTANTGAAVDSSFHFIAIGP